MFLWPHHHDASVTNGCYRVKGGAAVEAAKWLNGRPFCVLTNERATGLFKRRYRANFSELVVGQYP
jgi:hypothetical protein